MSYLVMEYVPAMEGGYRSALAADAFQKMGYTGVISLDGGWRAWNASGLPVEKP